MTTQHDYPLSESEALKLRGFTHLKQMRQQAKALEKSTTVPGLAADLWPSFSFTDFLNQMVGMSETHNFYLNRNYGNTWMHTQTKNGGMNVAYEELPYEWSAPHHYRVERIYSKGPLKYLCFEVQLRAQGVENTQVSCTIHFVSRIPQAVASLLIQKEIQRFIKAFETLAQRQAQGVQGLRVFFDDTPALTARIQELSARWSELEPQQRLREAVADYILRAPERLAYRLRPYELAELYLLDPLDVLKLCLRLTREGDFHLMWDCRCPGCKGPKESYAQLSELSPSAYCPSCAVSYNLAFDQNLELTFQPHSHIRPTQELYFCAGSPGNTPHISWQQNFLPNETRSFDLRLPPGDYVLRSLSCENEIEIEVSLEGEPRFEFELTERIQSSGPRLCVNPEAQLTVSNQNNFEVSLMLENIFWQAQAVSAADVQAVHDFHLLFPNEVLSPNESLPLTHQIFLDVAISNAEELLRAYTDDPNSDGSAILQENLNWAQNIIQQHEGAAIQPAEHSLRGIFRTPFDALSAAWRMLEERSDLMMLYEHPPEWQLGLGAGPCEIYNTGNRLGYRGEAVERAQSAAQFSQNQGIGIWEELLRDENMKHFIEHPDAQFSRSPDHDALILIQIESIWDL